MYKSKIELVFIVSLLSLATGVIAQKNITIPDTDPSIQYSGAGTGDVLICKVNSDGLVISGQAGCYNLLSNCTASFAAGQSPDSAASFKFKGSAIFITGLLYSMSPVYTVTLDDKSTDIDGVRDSRPFICSPLFSAFNLDPTVEHTIRLSVKGASPNRDMTVDPKGEDTVFGLVNFIYTVPDNATQASSSTNKGSSTTTSTSTSSSTSPSNNAARQQNSFGNHFISTVLGTWVLGAMVGYL